MIYDKTKHDNNDKYPNKEDFTTYFVYSKGKVILNGVPKSEYVEWKNKNKEGSFIHENIFDGEKFKEYRAKWHEKQNDLHKKYKDELFAYYGNSPFNDIIYSRAYEEGHSTGYEEIENIFYDLHCFVNEIFIRINEKF